jgi:hypothetical protein
MSTESTTETAVPTLEVGDIIFQAKFIQLAAQRGAILAEEMTTVGEHFNKLVAYLTAVGAVTFTENAVGAPTSDSAGSE